MGPAFREAFPSRGSAPRTSSSAARERVTESVSAMPELAVQGETAAACSFCRERLLTEGASDETFQRRGERPWPNGYKGGAAVSLR